ncbi:Uncharacterised protein [Yersinia similis]|nr:Uncharacterised protein [Yersinia similis]CNG58022.1 Uncharacterised protein [Yersinia pseudotuberculosis]CNK86829.1 Uncharacterised protein [Yersinia pseudotuberculosis]CRY72712.1 Uncharacterised protein [Yersinia pseudotuberculosis]
MEMEFLYLKGILILPIMVVPMGIQTHTSTVTPQILLGELYSMDRLLNWRCQNERN